MILGILPSLGGSIESQKKDQREGLFLGYYIPKYLEQFKKVHYFSYADTETKALPNVAIVANQLRWHRYLYAFLMPLLHRDAICACGILRVMHLNGTVPAIIAKWFYRIPFVTTYGYDYVKFAKLEGHWLKAKLLKLFIPFALKCANGVIVTTPALQLEVESYIGRSDKIQLIPNAVDINRFSPAHTGNPSNREPFRFLFIGRFERQKNIDFLFDVIDELKEQKPIILNMIGTGSLLEQFKQKAKQRKLPIQFSGSVAYESIPQRHRDSDCYISTSLAEGHPKALIEAMSSGLFCVVSDCPGHKDLIQEGRNGLLLGMDHVSHWVRALVDLIEDPRRRQALSEQARQSVVEKFSIHNTLTQETLFLTRTQALHGKTS